jgi:hypothetical protein
MNLHTQCTIDKWKFQKFSIHQHENFTSFTYIWSLQSLLATSPTHYCINAKLQQLYKFGTLVHQNWRNLHTISNRKAGYCSEYCRRLLVRWSHQSLPRLGLVHPCQPQPAEPKKRVRPWVARSAMPRPPKPFGRQTLHCNYKKIIGIVSHTIIAE